MLKDLDEDYYDYDTKRNEFKENPDKKKKGLPSSATFKVIFRAVQFICCDLQIIYDQSFCYLCVGAGNLWAQDHQQNVLHLLSMLKDLDEDYYDYDTKRNEFKEDAISEMLMSFTRE
jgi:hypothetical protein